MPQQDQDGTQTQTGHEWRTLDFLRRVWPIGFIVFLAIVCHVHFIGQHIAPMISRPWLTEWGARNIALSRHIGIASMVSFYFAQSLFLYCYFRCVCTSPGAVPDTHPWLGDAELTPTPAHDKSPTVTERKQSSGERRFCRWCAKYKPDRTHHCRQCKTCVLKMDHHCPWVGNCIGFKNYKFFLLCVFYAAVTIDLAAIIHFARHEGPGIFHERPAISHIMDGLWMFLATALTMFGFLHLWLVLHGCTTLEFRERGRDAGLYDRGAYRNVCSVLGTRPYLWLLPVSNAVGDGIDFASPAAKSLGSEKLMGWP